jgi:hypothetical protein
VTGLSFKRLFSMGAFEALRLIRLRYIESPEVPIAEVVRQIQEFDSDARALDFDAGVALDNCVRRATPLDVDSAFFRTCILDVIAASSAPWSRAIRLGRAKLVGQLDRDEIQCFRSAQLLDESLDDDVVDWWDELSSSVRASSSAAAMSRARQAERLSLQHEKDRLVALGIERMPRWTAIEDNTAGYDILSYDHGRVEPVNRLIEVKSTIASPLRFYLSRNEWEQAIRSAASYHFHVWDMSPSTPRLIELTQSDVVSHIPIDQLKGRWETAIIPLSVAR